MDADEIFVFSEQDLPSSSFSIFQEMKEHQELCDVTIKVRNQSFVAHRIVLSATIPYFRAMFRSKMKESSNKEICMEETDPTALNCLITFAYTGKLQIRNSEVHSLLQTSMYLQLNCVTNACFNHLAKQLNPDNVLSICACAESANHVSTIECANRFIRENFDDVSVTEAFFDLSLSRLKSIVCRDDLNVTSEEVVFEAVIKWVKASAVDRHIFLMELLQNIRFPFLSSEYLNKVCSTDEFIKSSPCREILEGKKNCVVKNFLSPWCFTLPERHCKEKHHLKCQKIIGSGMYGIVRGTFSNRPCLLDYLLNHSLCYYEFNKDEWVGLHDIKEIGSFSYVICLEEKIHFIRTGLLHTFNLKTLESTSVKCKKAYIPIGGEIVLHNCKAYVFRSGNNLSRNVHYFDPECGTCHKVGEMLTCRNDMAICSLGEYIYITGGKDPYNGTLLQSVERFDPVTGQCIEVSPMLECRSGHGCAALCGKLYIGGGGVHSAETYDPVTDKWTFIAPMSIIRNHLSLLSYDNKLYAMQTISDESKLEKDIEIYDPKEGVWKCGTPIPFSHVRVLVTNSAFTLQF